MVFSRPTDGERQQRQPEEQMQIRPQHSTGDPPAGVHNVVMMIPVDAEANETQAEVNETQHIAQQRRQQPSQRLAAGSVRQHAIAEGFHTRLEIRLFTIVYPCDCYVRP